VCRDKTGMEMGMEEPYVEGVATRDGPESRLAGREAGGEALTGVRAGRCQRRLPRAADRGGIRPKLRTVLADSGYVSEENFARRPGQAVAARAAGQRLRPGGRPPKRARHLDQYPATARTIRGLQHPRRREDYKLRARAVEPVLAGAQEAARAGRAPLWLGVWRVGWNPARSPPGHPSGGFGRRGVKGLGRKAGGLPR
jgi:hypothetical protein